MIAFLQGILEVKESHFAIMNVNGVGYRVAISTHTFEELPSSGDDIKLLIHHHITDSDQRLFGFFSEQEKRLFEMLVTVKGVGPKLGLTIMSGMKASALIEAIVQGDVDGLSRISGIGKKTAQRMVLELKEKILEGTGTGESSSAAGSGSGREEAISALEALGFRKKEAEKLVMDITMVHADAETADIVKMALIQKQKK